MNQYRLLPVLLLFICLATSCRKSHHTGESRCGALQEALMNNDFASVKSQVTKYINGLTSQQYTASNLDKLVTAISKRCGASAKVLCFDCIDTLPSQSEIIISFSVPAIEKVLDISYTQSNEMNVLNMH